MVSTLGRKSPDVLPHSALGVTQIRKSVGSRSLDGMTLFRDMGPQRSGSGDQEGTSITSEKILLSRRMIDDCVLGHSDVAIPFYPYRLLMQSMRCWIGIIAHMPVSSF